MAVIGVEGANVLRDGVVGDGVVETRVVRACVGGTDVAVVGVEGECARSRRSSVVASVR